jgi:hypothetical protein
VLYVIPRPGSRWVSAGGERKAVEFFGRFKGKKRRGSSCGNVLKNGNRRPKAEVAGPPREYMPDMEERT